MYSEIEDVWKTVYMENKNSNKNLPPYKKNLILKYQAHIWLSYFDLSNALLLIYT